MSGKALLSISRASGLGFVAGAAAALMWVAYAFWPEPFVLPYVIALCVTAACGLYVLVATYVDSRRNPRRGARIRPIRGFDVAVGLLLAGVAGWALLPFMRAF